MTGTEAAPRLIQLIDFDRAEGGSFIPVIDAISREAISRGWKSELICFATAHSAEWLTQLRDSGVTLRIAPEALRGRRIRLGLWLRRQLGDRDAPTVLHTHFHGFDIATLGATAGRTNTALVWHVHSAFPRDPVQLSRAVGKFALLSRSVDAFLCPAENIVEGTRKRGAPRDRVHLVPSAIEVDAFPVADDNERARRKRELGLDPDSTVLLHFGWHWELKGGDRFIQVLELMKNGDEVVGLERGGEEERYEAFAREHGVEEMLRIVPPVEHVRDLHAVADVMVCSSREEGMAYATLEALCTGTPVVATNIPGHAYVGDEVAACRLTEHTPEAIVEGIRETLARDPDLARAEGDEARTWVIEKLSTDGIAAQVVDRYAALLRGSP